MESQPHKIRPPYLSPPGGERRRAETDGLGDQLCLSESPPIKQSARSPHKSPQPQVDPKGIARMLSVADARKTIDDPGESIRAGERIDQPVMHLDTVDGTRIRSQALL
jgi:hypothetical protein